jgi:hypothetical protein
MLSGKPRCQFASVINGPVIEMPARAEQFNRRNFRARHFTHQSSGQFAVDEEVRGQDSLHRHIFSEHFMRIVSTLSETPDCVKASPDCFFSGSPVENLSIAKDAVAALCHSGEVPK